MNAHPTPSAVAVLIPTSWPPEQALAVFELLDDLRDRLWALHGDQIQALLHQEQGFAAGGLQSNEPNGDDRSF